MLAQKRASVSVLQCTQPGMPAIPLKHREDLMQPVFTAMDAFEFPELHDESISANNFFRQLSKLLGASGVKDFSWRVGHWLMYGSRN